MENATTKTESSSEVNYGMVSVYALLIVIIVVVILFIGGGSEEFKQPQTRSDLQGDWDIKSALARIAAQQEAILARIAASK